MNTEERHITVHFVPTVGSEPETFKPQGDERIGYNLSGSGEAPSYRIYSGRRTVLYPAGVVLKIDMVL